MLDPTAFAQYGQALNLSDAALDLIQTIRSSEPVRRVQSRVSNVCGRYPSRKMGRVIQAESRTVELVAIRCAYEFEPVVLEYWDQPCQIELTYLARNGRLVHVRHTPDFFVLRPNRAGWEEWKPMSSWKPSPTRCPSATSACLLAAGAAHPAKPTQPSSVCTTRSAPRPNSLRPINATSRF